MRNKIRDLKKIYSLERLHYEVHQLKQQLDKDFHQIAYRLTPFLKISY